MVDLIRGSLLVKLRVALRRLGVPAPIGKDPGGPDIPGPDDPEIGRPDPEVDAGIVRAQVEVIRRAFHDRGGIELGPQKGTGVPKDDADAHFLFRPRHAIIRQNNLEEVRRYFDKGQAYHEGSVRVVGEPTKGALVLELPRRLGAQDEKEDLLRSLKGLDEKCGKRTAAPDHVIYLTAYARMCPATEPEMIGKHEHGFPGESKDHGAGKGIRVGVVDSGLWVPAVSSPTTPWMHGVVADPPDEEHVDPAHIHPYAGHGTFVAGVVRCVAPATRVEVEGALTHGGAVYESEIVAQLDEALCDDDHPQLISISAGTHTWEALAPLSFEMLAAAHGLDDGEETIIIAAAGNDASDEPFWPAAFPWVVSVGSVDEDGAVSDYSNVGRWVDVYARGRDHTNAFPVGDYPCYEPPHVGQIRTFDGLARWSGTSFSTPIVTGLIAARMSATGENARQAWASVRAAATRSVDPRGGRIRTVGPLS